MGFHGVNYVSTVIEFRNQPYRNVCNLKSCFRSFWFFFWWSFVYTHVEPQIPMNWS